MKHRQQSSTLVQCGNSKSKANGSIHALVSFPGFPPRQQWRRGWERGQQNTILPYPVGRQVKTSWPPGNSFATSSNILHCLHLMLLQFSRCFPCQKLSEFHLYSPTVSIHNCHSDLPSVIILIIDSQIIYQHSKPFRCHVMISMARILYSKCPDSRPKPKEISTPEYIFHTPELSTPIYLLCTRSFYPQIITFAHKKFLSPKTKFAPKKFYTYFCTQ